MSFYNMALGLQPSATVVMAMLRLIPQDVRRWRDAWVGDDCLVLLTRQGDEPQEELQHREDFLLTFCNDFDPTFRFFHFKIPENHILWAAELKKMQHPNPADLKSRTEEFRHP